MDVNGPKKNVWHWLVYIDKGTFKFNRACLVEANRSLKTSVNITIAAQLLLFSE